MQVLRYILFISKSKRNPELQLRALREDYPSVQFLFIISVPQIEIGMIYYQTIPLYIRIEDTVY